MRQIKAFLLLTFLCLASYASAQEDPQAAVRNDSLSASLIIVSPGKDVWQLEGHAALRLRNFAGYDSIFNYGIFDFSSPNFLYRFVKGETDYKVESESAVDFYAPYIWRGRRVTEFPLQMSFDQTDRLRQMLEENARPENATYRYNYVKDNCSTRPLDMIERAIGDTIFFKSPAYTAGWSFRDAMRHYHTSYPWYQFGIDLALGSGIDYRISDREKRFAPELVAEMLPNAVVGAQGRKLLSGPGYVLVPGNSEGAPCAPTPWLLSPMALAILALALSIILAYKDIRDTRISRWWDFIIMGINGLAGCILTFLVFVSVHEATSPNWLLLWLNPFCLTIPIFIFIKRAKTFVMWFEFANFVAILTLAIVWPFTGQSGNPAFVPLIMADATLSARYIYVTICAKKRIRK